MSWALWITGLPGSGKTAIARRAAAVLRGAGDNVRVLELDEIRKVLTPAPTYGDAEREIVYRALGVMARLLTEAGTPVIVDATAHRREWRDLARRTIPRFAEVYLVCPLDVARTRERDRTAAHSPKDIYARASAPGATVPGVNVPYEAPVAPELVLDTAHEPLDACVTKVVALARGLRDARRPA